MAELKTKLTRASAATFISNVSNPQTQKECRALSRLLKSITRKGPRMWGTSIVGFGQYHYVGASGREGDWFLTGFSPRKTNLTIYIMGGLNKFPELLARLGKHKAGMGCIYVKSLSDIDLKVLEKLIRSSIKNLTLA